MAFHILEEIRKKPRDEWHQTTRDRWSNTRIWIQENGEAAFVLGLVLGLVVVTFHKLFIALLAVSVIIGGVLYMIAPDDVAPEENVSSEGLRSSEESSDDGDSNINGAPPSP